MDLITLQEYKDFYNIKKPDEDSRHSMLISMVSALIQTYIGVDADGGKQVTETISLDYDTDTIFLDNYPIVGPVTVSETSRYTWDSTVHVPLVYASDYSVNLADGILTRNYVVGGFANWPISPGNITVSYTTGSTWGYDVVDVPADLKLAAIELVKYYKDEEFKQSKTIMGTTQVNTLAKGTAFPQHIQVILDKYAK